MPGTPHRIRRQTWRIRTGSAAPAFRLRQAVRDVFEPSFLSAFEEACNEATDIDDVVHIPKLELHFQISSENQLDQLLPDAIRRQLRDLLHSRPANHEWKKSTPQQSRFEALIYYLQTGVLRWEKTSLSISESSTELKEVCRQHLVLLSNHVVNRAEAAPFFFRLLELLAPANAVTLVEMLKQNWPVVWSEAAAQVLFSLLSEASRNFSRHLQLQLAAAFLAEMIAQRQSATEPDLLSVAKTVLPQERAPELRHFFASLPHPSRRLFQAEKTTEVPIVQSTRHDNVVATHPLAEEVDGEFPLQVHHAGLVLLHPFLPRFLESTGIKNKNQNRLDTLMIPRAAALLHWLATGRQEIFEFELGLVKVLLGLRPESPLCVCDSLVSDTDREEAVVLLQTAIKYWSALKNTSVEGFRHSFLERPALLREDDAGWKLQVERLGFDLLLDHLPWGKSLVKLPWMAKPIHIEW